MVPRQLALLGVALLAMLTGCGSSQSSTSSPRPQRWDSVDAQVGDVHLLHVHVDAAQGRSHAAGSDVPLLVTISNKGSKSDTLVQVVSAYAERVVYRDGDGAVKSPLSITVPPGDVASLQALGGPHLELENLQADKTQASSYPVTFRFSGAGSVTVSVPVSSRAEPVVSTSPGPPTTTGGSVSSLGLARRPSDGTPG